MAAPTTPTYTALLADTLKHHEALTNWIYLDSLGYPTTAVGILLAKGGTLQPYATTATNNASNPTLVASVFSAIVAAQSDPAKLKNDFLIEKDRWGNQMLSRFKGSSSSTDPAQWTDIRALWTDTEAMAIAQQVIKEKEALVDQTIKAIHKTDPSFSLTEAQRVALVSRAFNGFKVPVAVQALTSGDPYKVLEFLTWGRGGSATKHSDGHYPRLLHEFQALMPAGSVSFVSGSQSQVVYTDGAGKQAYFGYHDPGPNAQSRLFEVSANNQGVWTLKPVSVWTVGTAYRMQSIAAAHANAINSLGLNNKALLLEIASAGQEAIVANCINATRRTDVSEPIAFMYRGKLAICNPDTNEILLPGSSGTYRVLTPQANGAYSVTDQSVALSVSTSTAGGLSLTDSAGRLIGDWAGRGVQMFTGAGKLVEVRIPAGLPFAADLLKALAENAAKNGTSFNKWSGFKAIGAGAELEVYLEGASTPTAKIKIGAQKQVTGVKGKKVSFANGGEEIEQDDPNIVSTFFDADYQIEREDALGNRYLDFSWETDGVVTASRSLRFNLAGKPDRFEFTNLDASTGVSESEVGFISHATGQAVYTGSIFSTRSSQGETTEVVGLGLSRAAGGNGSIESVKLVFDIAPNGERQVMAIQSINGITRFADERMAMDVVAALNKLGVGERNFVEADQDEATYAVTEKVSALLGAIRQETGLDGAPVLVVPSLQTHATAPGVVERADYVLGADNTIVSAEYARLYTEFGASLVSEVDVGTGLVDSVLSATIGGRAVQLSVSDGFWADHTPSIIGIRSVNGVAAGLDAVGAGLDLGAFGFTWDRILGEHMPVAAEWFLDAALQGAPQVSWQSLYTGATRQVVEFGTGAKFSAIYDAFGNVVQTDAAWNGDSERLLRERSGGYSIVRLSPASPGTTLATVASYDVNGAQTIFRQQEIHEQNYAAEQERLQKIEDSFWADTLSFISAIRAKDKAGVLLAGARMSLVEARRAGTSSPALEGAIGAASEIYGIVGALRGLRSNDFRVQVGSAVGLLSNANSLVARLQGPQGTGFLPTGVSTALGAVSAVLSIAALADLDDMLENGQYGAAITTVASAINSVGFLASGMTNAFMFIPGPWMVAIAIFSAILDSTADEPPPPPPVGTAVFKRLAGGSLGYEILNAANGGHEILSGQMEELLAKLNQQLAQANAGNSDPDRQLQLIASRMPQITIQSWPSHQEGTNYFFVMKQVDPITREPVFMALARQDLVRHYAETLVAPEAVVQAWEVNHLTTKFGPDEANWRTEGQFLASASIVAQRSALETAVSAAEDALAAAREGKLSAGAWAVEGDITGNVTQAQSAAAEAIGAAEAALASAQAALADFNAATPEDPQMAARIIDPTITDPAQMQAAREAAKRQWVKVIAVDLGGDGVEKTGLPGVVGTDLNSIQNDGITRFDTDNDGFREATEWIAGSDAILGIDRDGNGVLDSASELFNGVNTAFDQRGLASLKYYDSNNDNRIDATDAVYKLLRLWVDLNADGSAGAMETFDLQMRHPGVDMAALGARLDAVGQAALASLQGSAVQYIDLATFQLHLADQTTAQASDVALQSEVEGIMLALDEQTQNISVLHENGLRENYITLVEDMSALLELGNTSITAGRRTELEAMAVRYGLNTQSPDFLSVVRSLQTGGQNMGASGAVAIYLGSDDVWTNPDVRSRLEEMRFSFHTAQSVGSSDVYGTARVGAPVVIGAGTSVPVFDDNWTAPHQVQQSEVTSDAPTVAPAPAPAPEQWVLLQDVYNLDYVVRGAQLGGLVTQQAVIASNAAIPNAPQQTIQVYTTAAPTLSLVAVTIAGKEDEQFGFGFTQLEQEARSLMPDATPATAVRLLGVRSVAHGRVEIDETLGRVRFIGDENYYGADAGFSYAVMDEQGRVMERRVQFNLAEVNDAPDVLGETVQAQEDVPLLLDAATLLANDSDLEGDALSIIGIGRVGMGRAELLQNGQIRYTPPADLYGVTDTIEYIVQDARGGSAVAVVKITLHAVDDAPTVVSEVIRNAKEDTNLRIDAALLLANDYDADFHNQSGAAQLRITAVGNATHGSAFLDASGTIIFVPADNYNGTATFEYTVTDETGLSTVGKAEVEIGAVNDGPRAFGELITSTEDQKLVIDPDLLLANDDDIDIGRGENQRLMIVAVDQAVNGTVKLENGHVAFTPAYNFNGEASFRYTVSDGAGGFAQAVARIAISGENDAPTILNRSYIGQEDTAYSFTPQALLDGVLDPEDGATGVTLVSVDNVSGGTLELVDGSYVLTPGANFNGVARFQYTVADAQGLQSTGEVAVKFSEVNDAPIFIPGSTFTKQGEEDQPVRISLDAIKKMFIDVDGDALSIDTSSLAAVQSGDTVTYDAAKQEVVFKAAKDANGLRHFDVRVVDEHGAYSSSQRIGVDLKALNDSPIVNAVGFQVLEDGGWNDPNKTATNYMAYSLLLGQASDADGDALSLHSVGNGRTGDGREVAIIRDDARNRIAFTLPLNYNGTFSFDFSVSDGKGGVTSQKAYGSVVAVDDVPTLQAVRMGQAMGYYDYWRLEASDVDGHIVSYGIDRNPLRGTILMGQALSYWPGGIRSFDTGDVSFHGYVPAHYELPIDGAANDLLIITLDGKGYAQETQTAVMTATDNGGNVAKANLSFIFRWDPIVIDLDSNGLEFIDIDDSTVLIDRDGDGTNERSAWIKGSEGILAWDHNADGVINRYDEIEFWSHVQPEDPTRTDLQSLARPEFDSNQDGVFNSLDTKWGQFKLWRDLNENGVSDEGELSTLDAAGVAALHLHANVLNRRYGEDVLVRGYTRLEMTDGRMLQAGDVQLDMTDPNAPSLAVAPTEQQQNATTASATQVQQTLAAEQAALAAARRAGDPNFTGDLGEQKVLTGQTYRYVLPASLFPALGAGATYAVTLASGQALPAWLQYDAATRTLSGTPQAGQMGNWSIKVTGTAAAGGATSSGFMALEVTDFNQAPIALGSVPSQYALEDQAFSLDIAPNLFVDREAGDTLRYTATLADGSALPSWLTFDAEMLAFRGTPPNAAVGVVDIVLKAFDEANAAASTRFKLIIEGVNDAPVVSNAAQAMVGMRVGEANSYQLPAGMFVDEDGDPLTWTVTMANGDALPSWLSFDPANRTLSGAPTPEQLSAALQLRVTATDTSGGRTSTLVTVTSTIYGTAGDDALLGSNASEDLWGEAGNDTIDGGSGADRLIGGAGNDTFLVDALDTVFEQANAGVDTVVSAGTWTLDDTLENLTLTGSASVNGTGNAADNVLRGNAGANVLTGGAGNDTYYVGAGDTIVEQAGKGTETAYASASYVLDSNVEHLVLTGSGAWSGTGNALDNSITGNAAANVLDGGEGVDSLAGGAGDDTYHVDAADTVLENAGEGVDTVMASGTYTLGATLENLVLTGTEAINGTGNALDNQLTGNAAANVLTGGAGNDTYDVDAADTVVEEAGGGIDTVRTAQTHTLAANVENLQLTGNASVDGTGNALDNVLSGNSGSNILAGGAGNDVYVVDSVGDHVVEQVGEGVDSVQSSVSFTLGANVENLTLTGAAATNGTGNSLANVLVGNSAANTLAGDGGADTLSGGGGNDALLGDAEAPSFAAPTMLRPGFVVSSTWTNNNTYPREMADVNGDGRADIVGFGSDGVYLSLTKPDGTFDWSFRAMEAFGTAQGWTSNDTHLRKTGDVNGDGFADLIGFSGLGTYVALSNGNGSFGGSYLAYGGFTTNGGSRWTSNDTMPREIADVNGDGRADIVGFRESDVLVSLGQADGYFGAPFVATTGFVSNSGWASNNTTPRRLADVNGDGRADIVGFGSDGTYVALADGTGSFGAMYKAHYSFGQSTGWTSQNALPREVADVNGDGRADLVGFGSDALWVALAQADGSFGTATSLPTQFGSADGLTNNDQYPRRLADINGDGRADLIGFAYDAAYGALSAAASGADVLNGGDGSDLLQGMAGADTLDGGAGGDTMEGGAGSDTYYVDNTEDVVREAAKQGSDTVYSSVTYTLVSQIETLILTGSAAINGTGNALTNWIHGNAGDNVLDGGAGWDRLAGGQGNDTYYVDIDTVDENANEGIDTVYAANSFTLDANLENLYLTGSGAFNGTGNGLDNILTGGSGANVLTGGAGNDTLDGGLGTDTLNGGVGDDTYVVDNASDAVAESAGAGWDSVRAGVNWTLAANVESLLLTGSALYGWGNSLDNWFEGNANANTFWGAQGNDIYVLGAGDNAVEQAGEGTDGIITSQSWQLGANFENLTLTGSNSVNAIGNALNNVLTGNSGGNVLDGVSGADAMLGGAGDDTYVTDGSDTITEYANEGTDTVNSYVTYELTANVENLTLLGAAGVNGVGNSLNNVIRGNDGGNVLLGYGGDDTYYAGENDVVVEYADQGIDTVNTWISWTLGSHIENLTLIGGSAINGAGNNLDNVLEGNSAANVLWGYGGNDTYVVGAGDVAIEEIGQGLDTVRSYVSWTLGDNFEHLVLIGTDAINGTGNQYDNMLSGNLAANVLWGLGGNDTYVVGAGDTVVEYAGQGNDTIQSSLSWTLGANIENLLLVGSSAADGAGNELDNVLAGNAGVNVLAGGAGNDTYVISTGDTVVEAAGAGNDTVHTDASHALAANVENLVLLGAAAANGWGNQLGNTFTGNAGVNTFWGGAGDDTYVLGAEDSAVESASEGVDTLHVATTLTLAANFENLVLTGAGAVDGTGNAVANVLQGNAGTNTLSGLEGDDVLIAAGVGDTLLGGAGNDVLLSYGRSDSWNHTFDGGSGNDFIVGSYAKDTFKYALGGGDDTILDDVRSYEPGRAAFWSNTSNPDYQDKLAFGAGISAADVTVRRSAYDAIFGIAGGGSVTVRNWYHGQYSRIEQVTFADGTVWTSADVDARTQGISGWGTQVTGTGYNDTLHGTQNYPVLLGGAGDDILAAREASAVAFGTFQGGTGADTISGTYAGDVYKFDLGDGRDTISDDVRIVTVHVSQAADFASNPSNSLYWDRLDFGAGIAAADVALSRHGDDLKLSLANGTDSVTVTNWFNGIFTRLEEVRFTNGTSWTADQIESMMGLSATTAAAGKGVQITGSGTLTGGAGGDVLVANAAYTTLLGGAGNDTLGALADWGGVWNCVFEGGTGNDHITGSYARDLYRFNRGDGQDTIRDDVNQHAASVPYYQQDRNHASYEDKLQFGAGIAADQLWFSQSGWDLEVSVIGTNDKVTIDNWYWSPEQQLEVFELADGKRLLDDDVQRLVQAMAGFSPPAAGQTTLSQTQQAVLGAEIAAAWK